MVKINVKKTMPFERQYAAISYIGKDATAAYLSHIFLAGGVGLYDALIALYKSTVGGSML